VSRELYFIWKVARRKVRLKEKAPYTEEDHDLWVGLRIKDEQRNEFWCKYSKSQISFSQCLIS
jgi:hypothetical protein